MKFKGSGAARSRKGKDFYIVLALCAAVLASSGYIAVKGVGTDVEAQEAAESYVREYSVADEPVSEPVEDTAALPVMAEAEPEQSKAVSYIPPVDGGVQRPYSVETLLYDATMNDWRTHAGVDYACAEGTAVVAAADGTVVSVASDALLGATVRLLHADGMETVYSNLSDAIYVLAGETVEQGQIIGTVGKTALAEANEASHLHFAMQCSGISADPDDYIA